MQVFISWSQPTSRQIAEILKKELYSFFNEKIEFWVSSKDIPAGDVSITSIISALQKSDMIITCLDSSNYNKSWTYFETGVVFGRNYDRDNIQPVVLPIIFDNLEVDDFKKTPFTDLQLQKFSRKCVEKIINDINQKYKDINGEFAIASSTLQKYFKETWSNLHKQVNTIIMQQTSGSDILITDKNVTEIISRYKNFPIPSYGRVIKYDSGFETSYFYDFLLENVKKRLYIFGRKNRKIGDRTLSKKFESVLKKDIDLKMLFLNPNSEYAKGRKAQDTDSFREKLVTSIKEIHERFISQKLDISQYCRMYDNLRTSEIIIADEVIFYKDMAYSKDGKPLHFTDNSFCITPINSILGNKYFKVFETAWDTYEDQKITTSFISTLT